MEEPRRSNGSLDIDELLEKGFWTRSSRGTRSRSPAFDSSHDVVIDALPIPVSRTRRAPSGSRPQNLGPPPPPPFVEDELLSLAKELDAALHVAATIIEPPFRGSIDQQPVILEATIVGSTELESLLDDDTTSENPHLRTKEAYDRRFVLLRSPDGDENDDNAETSSTEHHDPDEDYNNDKRSKKHEDTTASTRNSNKINLPKSSEDKTRDTDYESKAYQRDRPPAPYSSSNFKDKDSSGSSRAESRQHVERERHRSAAPPLQRRRSRQDLPSIKTDMGNQMPSFRRTASETGQSHSASSPMTSSSFGDFLSPDTGHTSKSHTRGLDTSSRDTSNLRQQIMQGLANSKGAPTNKRPPGSPSRSHPPSPTVEQSRETTESRSSRSRRNSPDRSNKGFLHVEDADSRHKRQSSAPAGKSSGDVPHNRNTSISSNVSSKSRYDSSGSESDSDYEKGRRASRHHRHRRAHSRDSCRRADDGLLHQPDESRRRSSSRSSRVTEAPTGSKLETRNSMPVNTSQPILNTFEPKRGDTFPKSQDYNRKMPSREPSPSTPSRAPMDASSSPFIDSRNAFVPIVTRNGSSTPREVSSPPMYNDYEDSSRPATTPADSYWQPPPLQPVVLERPVGSFRRYSQDIEGGRVHPLPPCPRTTPVKGHNDWLTLPGCPQFNICSSCYGSIMVNTDFRSSFLPSPLRGPDVPVLCDFGSSAWYRIAWLLALKEGRRDLRYIKGIARVQADVPPCLGKHEATQREWYSVEDPDTKIPLPKFNVCGSCVYSIEVLLPSLRGTFVRSDLGCPSSVPRICSMRFDSKRFVQYFDALETAADLATDSGSPPDTHELVALVKRYAPIEECQQDTDLTHRRWYVITQLPEFTVCEECWHEIVEPEADRGKAIPTMFNRTGTVATKTSCQLYSPRMRRIFSEAVASNQYAYLATNARQRKKLELAYKAEVAEVKREARDRARRREEYWEKDILRDRELIRERDRGGGESVDRFIRERARLREKEKEYERKDIEETRLELAKLERDWKIHE